MSDSLPQNGAVDPDVRMPPAVLAAARRADDLHAQLRDAPPAQESEGEPDAQKPAVVTPEVTPQNDKVPQENAEQITHKTADKTTDKTADKTKKVDPTDPNDETWERRYRAMHGRFMQASDENRRLKARIEELEALIATVQAPAAAAPDAPAEINFEKLVTDEERNDYGEDFMNVVARRAQEAVGPILASQKKFYEKKISDLELKLSGVAQHVNKSSRKELLESLGSLAPDWKELNTDTDFLAWLDLPDPYSGAIRRDMLSAAYSQGDVHRVAAFFNGYLAEQATVAPGRTDPDPETKPVDKVPLETLAAPGRAKSAAAANAPASKPIITRAQIAKFYADVAAGAYRGRDAEKDAQERMIFSAQQEGRIQ